MIQKSCQHNVYHIALTLVVKTFWWIAAQKHFGRKNIDGLAAFHSKSAGTKVWWWISHDPTKTTQVFYQQLQSFMLCSMLTTKAYYPICYIVLCTAKSLSVLLLCMLHTCYRYASLFTFYITLYQWSPPIYSKGKHALW